MKEQLQGSPVVFAIDVVKEKQYALLVSALKGLIPYLP